MGLVQGWCVIWDLGPFPSLATFPLDLRVHSWREASHTIEKATEGWCAAPGAPGATRPWNQHAELGPVATSEAPRGQKRFLVKGLTGHLCRRRGEDGERAWWLGPRAFPATC